MSTNKNIIVSFDDVFKNNDRFVELQRLKQEIPELKVTMFVITKDDEEYLNSLKTNWTEIVFHSYEHSGAHEKWDVERAEYLLKMYAEMGFANGFKAPGWKMTQTSVML